MNLPRLHRLAPIREDTDDRVQDPVMPTVSAPDWRTGPLSIAVLSAIVSPHGVYAHIRPALQQGFQRSRGVGMVSG